MNHCARARECVCARVCTRFLEASIADSITIPRCASRVTHTVVKPTYTYVHVCRQARSHGVGRKLSNRKERGEGESLWLWPYFWLNHLAKYGCIILGRTMSMLAENLPSCWNRRDRGRGFNDHRCDDTPSTDSKVRTHFLFRLRWRFTSPSFLPSFHRH